MAARTRGKGLWLEKGSGCPGRVERHVDVLQFVRDMRHVHVEKGAPIRVHVSIRNPLLTVGDEATSLDGLGNGARAVRDVWVVGERKPYLG